MNSLKSRARASAQRRRLSLPQDKLEGREKTSFAERDRKLERARALRAARRSTSDSSAPDMPVIAASEVQW